MKKANLTMPGNTSLWPQSMRKRGRQEDHEANLFYKVSSKQAM